MISLNFSAKKTVSYLAILLDYTTDDSYTPKQVRYALTSHQIHIYHVSLHLTPPLAPQ